VAQPKVYGKEVSKGLDQSFLSKLDQALKLAPGKMSPEEDNKWKSLIGTDDAPKAKQGTDGAKNLKVGQQPGPPSKVVGRSSAAPSPALKPARPERAGTKRRYNEASFKGYGEGYPDDDVDLTGPEDDAKGGGMKKKRRKDFPVSSPLGLDQRSPGYNNVGVVGVRR